MKSLTIVSCGLFLFGAGFFVGHYGGVTISSDITTTKIETQDTVAYTKTPKQIQKSPLKVDPPTQATNVKSMVSRGAMLQAASKTLLPHEVFLTAEAQSQLAAQQWEAKQAEIHQIDAMIQSMEENGLPSEDIKSFHEMKKAKEEQLLEIPQASDTHPIERTETELEKDFVASLEQAGVPPAERDKMLETFSSSPKMMDVKPTPPHEQK